MSKLEAIMLLMLASYFKFWWYMFLSCVTGKDYSDKLKREVAKAIGLALAEEMILEAKGTKQNE